MSGRIVVETFTAPLYADQREFMATLALGAFIRRAQMTPVECALEDRYAELEERTFLFGSTTAPEALPEKLPGGATEK